MVTCWKTRQLGPMVAPGLMTMPLGWGMESPPAMRLLIGISAPVTALQRRWERTAYLETTQPIGPARPFQRWYLRIARSRRLEGSHLPNVHRSRDQSGTSALTCDVAAKFSTGVAVDILEKITVLLSD